MPMAASSAIMPEIVAALVLPGTAIMSKPTEQTAVIASNLSKVKTPLSAAAIMPSSSDTGINAPLKPPTALLAIMPPFLTASFNNASAAVVPCVPQTDKPIASKIRATLSPTAGVGASDKSKIPNGIFNIFAASCPINSPTRVILNAVFFTISAISVKLWLSQSFKAA